jgi:hypothetical protein
LKRIAICLWIFACTGLAQENQSLESDLSREPQLVKGEIVAEGGYDLGRLSVRLRSFVTPRHHETSVVRTGQFVLRDVAPGAYVLEVLDSNGDTLASEPLQVVLMMPPLRVHVTPRNAPRPAGGAISAARLMHRPVKKAVSEAAKAEKLARGGAYSEAAKHLEEAVRLDPGYFLAHNNLGVQYMRLGRFPEAVTALERAIALDPSAVETQRNLAFALLNMGRVEEAQSRARIAAALAKRHTPPQ